jgi:hypothetical protein
MDCFWLGYGCFLSCFWLDSLCLLYDWIVCFLCMIGLLFLLLQALFSSASSVLLLKVSVFEFEFIFVFVFCVRLCLWKRRGAPLILSPAEYRTWFLPEKSTMIFKEKSRKRSSLLKWEPTSYIRASSKNRIHFLHQRRQDKTRQDNKTQDNTTQDNTGKAKARPDNKTQHNTRQHTTLLKITQHSATHKINKKTLDKTAHDTARHMENRYVSRPCFINNKKETNKRI